jgi:predicted Zn-dependent protease
VLEGEILAAQNKWSEAAITFKAGLDRQPVPAVAARYYAALVKGGKATEANAMAAKWMRDHPDDSSIPLILAQSAQARNDLAAAKSGYQKVLDIDADSVIALNNLAWILADQKDPKALEYAERAHRLAPFTPSVLDTLGWTLARTGESKRGVQLLRMASRLAPTQGNIRLHLAKALIESGDKAAAKQELAELAKLDKASPIRIEAEKLQATL